MKTIELAGASWITENLKDNEGNQLFTHEQALKIASDQGLKLPSIELLEKLSKLPSVWDDKLNGRWFAENEADLKKPDRSLFLPASGHRGDGIRYYVETYGYYWSSVPGKYLEFCCVSTNMGSRSAYRSDSLSVRCVKA